MVNLPNHILNKHALAAFMAVLIIFLVIVDVLIFNYQQNKVIKSAQNHSQRELNLFGKLIRESLLKGDYATIEIFINQWGQEQNTIHTIKATSSNGFIIGEYLHNHTDLVPFKTQQKIYYAPAKFINIEIVENMRDMQNNLSNLLVQLILVSIFITLMLGVFMWHTLNRTAIRPLQEEIKKRNIVESELILRSNELETARDQALSATRSKSEFLANMSHELRTPLNSILGFTGIIKDSMAGPINEEQSKQLEMVYGSATHLLNLINDILDLSKVEAGKTEIIHSEFNLPDLLEEIGNLIKPQVKQKSLVFFFENHNAIENIYTDRSKLKQVLINLLSNAVKFTSVGHIALRYRLGEQNQLIITVEDTGIGIPDDKQESIFSAFQQVDFSTTRPYEGTGLGLAICQKFIDLLGGMISVNSKLNEGSLFKITLPSSVSIESQSHLLTKSTADISLNITNEFPGKKPNSVLANTQQHSKHSQNAQQQSIEEPEAD